MVDQPRDGTAVLRVLLGVSVTVVAVLPAFLLGALAMPIHVDLGVGPAGIGAATATLFGVSAITSRQFGLLVQRLGAYPGMAIATFLSACALAGCALAPHGTWLVGAMAIGGVGNGIAHPSVNLLLSRVVTNRRLGLAFGIKQAAIPGATLLAGLAVPVIAITLGWRWAFFAAAAIAASLGVCSAWSGFSSERGMQGQPSAVGGRAAPGGIWIIAMGCAVALAGSTAMGVFLVSWAVETGWDASGAGLLVASASIFGVAVRVCLGWLADHVETGRLHLVVVHLMGWGATGYALLAVGTTPALVAGAYIAYGVGWAWPGLTQYVLVDGNRSSVASVTGILQTGTSFGAAAGPLAFGLLIEATSYTRAWWIACGLSVIGAALMYHGQAAMRRASSGDAFGEHGP